MAKITTSSENVGLREFRENTGKYVAALKKGKKFTIFKHSKPIFAVVPASEIEYDLDTVDGPGWETVIRFPNKEGITTQDFLKMLKNPPHGQNKKVRS